MNLLLGCKIRKMKSVEALGFGLITLGLIVVCSFIGRVEASSSELLPRSVIYYNDNGRELNFTSSRYTHLVLVINTKFVILQKLKKCV